MPSVFSNLINSRFKIYFLLFWATVIFAGGSVFYMWSVARFSEAPNARLYPASSLGAGGVTMDNYIMTKNLVLHGVFSRDIEPPFTPDTWRTPGYPVFAAPFYAIFGSFYPVVIFQVFLLFITTVLIFKMAEKLTNTKWALALSLIYLVLPDTLMTTSAIFAENPFVFVLILALYIFFFSNFKNFYLKWILTGFLLALSAYIRPASFYILLFFVPAYFIFYLKKNEITKKQFAVMGLLVLVFTGTLAPWYMRNRIKVGDWTFASTGSYVLFRQFGAQFYQSLTGEDTVTARKSFLKMAGIPQDTVPRDTEYSEKMQKFAINFILSHPVRYALFHFSTFIPFFTSAGSIEYSRFIHDLLPNYNPAPEPSLLQALHPFSLPLLITVLKNHGWTLIENFFWAVIAFFAFFSFLKSSNPRLTRMFFAIIMYFAIVTGPIAHARYRMPVDPLLLICAFSAAWFLWQHLKFRFIEVGQCKEKLCIKYVTNVRIPTPRAQGYAIMKMCSEFSKASAEVTLFVPERASRQFDEDPFSFYKLNKTFEIKKIGSSDFLGATKRFGKFFYWLDTLSFLALAKFSIFLRKGEALYTRDFAVASIFSKKRFICLELHDLPKSKFWLHKALKKTRLIFVLNENLKKELIALGVSTSKIHIAPSGVDLESFNIAISKEEARKKMSLPLDKKIIMYTGHLYEWKGSDTLAKVATLLPGASFVFVGGVEPEFSKFTKEFGSHENIIIRPFSDRSYIPFYLKAADILVVPNSAKEKISSEYTSPLKLFEYMAAGRPIVASDLPSIRRVLDEGGAVFAEADNSESFATAIEKLLSNSELANKMVNTNLRNVKEFSWEKRAQKILDIIRNA